MHPGMLPPEQTPPAHVSPLVHTSPSSHEPPSLVGAASQSPVAALHVPMLQSSSNPVQSTGIPVHDPRPHTVFTVQRSPSSHGSPSLTGAASQAPVAALHTPTLQSSSSPVQSVGVPAHTPPVQTSPTLHKSPSVHGSVLFVLMQNPLGWQESSVHGLASLHSVSSVHLTQSGIGVPMHTPDTQTSDDVQSCPSSHERPLLIGRASHSPEIPLHTPTLHASSRNEQLTANPPQLPTKQTSPFVQASPSSHASPSLVAVASHTPLTGLHTPTLHASSKPEQSTAEPPHTPSEQTSPAVQISPSSHGAVLSVWATDPSGLHTSSVQRFESSMTVSAPVIGSQHCPGGVVSVCVTVPSGLHVSVVHAVPSSIAVSRPVNGSQH